MRRRTLAMYATLVVACKGGSEPPPRDAGGSAAPAFDPATLAVAATLADQVGAVDARRKGEPTWEAAKIGTTFRERDWVRTGEPGYARLRFSAKRFIDMPEKTTIIVDSEITIEAGSLVAVASGGESLRVRAADGTVAQIVSAPGDAPSELRLTPSKSKGLEIAVTKGTARVVTGDGEQSVAAGELSYLANNRTSSVIKLLASPTGLVAPEGLVHAAGVVVPLSWGQVPGAARYRVQVARDDSFHQLLLDRELGGPTVEFTPDKPGAYAWRVAAIDDKGHVGSFGAATRVTIEAAPPPDLLLAPANGAKIGFAGKTPAVTFTWKPTGDDAESYRLVIVRGLDMTKKPVATLTTRLPRAEVRTLREGTYHWGVFAMRAGGESPIFAAPRALTIRKQRVKVHTEKLWQSR